MNAAGRALVGCGSAVASGGKCGPGALAGGVTALASPLTNGRGFVGLVMSSTVGGLASVAGGGKFANGAVTGAFAYLFSPKAGDPGLEQEQDAPRDVSTAQGSQDRPELQNLTDNLTVRAAIQAAWDVSDPYGSTADKNEQGFFIFVDAQGNVTTQNFPSGWEILLTRVFLKTNCLGF